MMKQNREQSCRDHEQPELGCLAEIFGPMFADCSDHISRRIDLLVRSTTIQKRRSTAALQSTACEMFCVSFGSAMRPRIAFGRGRCSRPYAFDVEFHPVESALRAEVERFPIGVAPGKIVRVLWR